MHLCKLPLETKYSLKITNYFSILMYEQFSHHSALATVLSSSEHNHTFIGDI